MSNFIKHQKFIEEIQASLRQDSKKAKRKSSLFDDEEDDDDVQFDIELQKELERKFNELFGSVEDE